MFCAEFLKLRFGFRWWSYGCCCFAWDLFQATCRFSCSARLTFGEDWCDNSEMNLQSSTTVKDKPKGNRSIYSTTKRSLSRPQSHPLQLTTIVPFKNRVFIRTISSGPDGHCGWHARNEVSRLALIMNLSTSDYVSKNLRKSTTYKLTNQTFCKTYLRTP